MNLHELDNYKLAKAIDFNTDLNPQLFSGDKMRPLVRNALMDIADHFREFLGVQDIALIDIEVSGSNAAYSYTPHSDVDLHLIVDFTKLSTDSIYKELFNAKQYQYNDMHDLKIKGYDVELYVQDAAQPHHSLGSYSVLKNKWTRIPTKQRANLDDQATHAKYEKLKALAVRALASDNNDYLNSVLEVVKKYRQAGLDKHGEFGPENLAFKMLRTDGYFEKLWAKKRGHEDRALSLETSVEEPDTLAQELMAELNGDSTTQQTEGMIKRMSNARSSLFDDFDYDYVQEAAGKLVTLEAAYDGNLGFMEVMQFYKEASKEMVDLLNRLVAADKTKEAWALVQKFTKTELVGKEFNESADPTSEDLDNVADWMDTNVDNLTTELVMEPMRKFSQQAQEMLDSYDEFPEDANRTHKISNLIDSGEKRYPVYVAKNDPDLFVMEGRHRMVSFYIKGFSEIPVAYVSKKVNEGVGIITKQNQTADVGPNQTKIEAAKLGHTVNKGGIPPILKTNGKTKTPTNVMESKASFTPSNVRDWIWDNKHAEAYNSGYCGEFAMMLGILFDVKYYEISSDHSNGMHYFVTINGQPVDCSGEYDNVADLVDAKDYYEPGLKVTQVSKKDVADADAGTYQGATKLANNVQSALSPLSVMESIKQLDELKMAPGHLQKEVNKILHSARPRIGLEFEVIFPEGEGEEGNPDINSSTTFDDIKEFFSENSDDGFDPMTNMYQTWLDDKQNEWAEDKATDTLNTPNDEDYNKKEFMVDYTMSEDAEEAVQRITGNDDDTEITEEIAIDTIARADQIFKARGPADEWPTPPLSADPYIVLYYEIFVEDKDEAHDYFRSFYYDEFYNSEMTYNDNEYSMGSYLQSIHINSMGDVFREWSDSLYWTGGSMYDGEFDENLAQSVADDLSQDLGIETDVGNGYIDDQAEVDYSTWHVTSDESINPTNDGDSGMEIVTSVMDYEDGIQDVEEFIQYLHDKNAYTNESTGLHINVSMGNIDHANLDYAKLVVMLGDSHILKQFGREFNEYAMGSLAKLGEMMDETQGYQRDKDAKAKSYAILMNKMKTNLSNVVSKSLGKLHIDKYNSVGLKDNRIEFRSAGGSDYLNNFQAILDLINRFIVAYAVAADPEAHKKEYGKKLYKLASNVGNGQVPKSTMTLFAGFGAGIISKDDLIRHLKAKRAADRAQAEYDKTVDTGEPRGIPAFADLEGETDAIQVIAKKYHYTNAAAYAAWEQGYGVEKVGADNDKMAFARTYNNLIRDVNHYSGPEETGF